MLLGDLLDLVLPTDCAGCGGPGRLLCAVCAPLLTAPAREVLPDPVPAQLPPTYAVGAYGGPLRAVLLAYKEHGRSGLAGPLGAALARCVRTCTDGPVALVPVPSRPAAVAERGADHVLVLARRTRAALRASGRPARVVQALRHTGRAVDSAGLGAAARAANSAGAFGPGPATPRASERLVLIDDLVTTGATLAAAATVLRSVGLDPYGAAVVAATARHQMNGQ